MTASGAARGHSIALPIFLLALGAIVVATAITFAITFAGPPPVPAPVRLDHVARALAGRPMRTMDGSTIVARSGASVSTGGLQRDSAFDARIAALIGRGTVQGFYERPGGFAPWRDDLRGAFVIGWHDGTAWRTVVNPPNRARRHWIILTLSAMAAALAGLALVGWTIARAISRPLRDLERLAAGARVFGSAPAVPTHGPREVRALGNALAAMHGRLAAHAEGRTAMFAAIAHDLGTPLSRLAFWVEQLPEPARTRAAGDIDEMRDMIGQVLRFARDERSSAQERVDLSSVLDALVDDLGVAGQPVTLEAGPRAIVRGDASALRRLFANLLANAVRYGGAGRIGWTLAGSDVIVHVDDDGPGFTPDEAKTLFEPFVRGDPSRNRATGGTGLGLAIVRSLVEAHGGSVTLGRSPAGGGRVTVTLLCA